jgi:hypothetical protein
MGRPHVSDETQEAVAERIQDRTGSIDAAALPFDRQVELLVEKYDELATADKLEKATKQTVHQAIGAAQNSEPHKRG